MAPPQTASLLIVDDEQELREILSEQLIDLKFEVEGVSYSLAGDLSGGVSGGLALQVASNGQEALERFREFEFDALLTDVNMPVMNGLELLAALRGAGCHVPSVVLTGFADKSKAAEALRLGCFAFLDKPWRASQLQKAITGALKRGVAQRQLNRKVESRVEEYSQQSDSRQRQLRSVFRSILIDDGSHRNDVCAVPTRPKKSAS